MKNFKRILSMALVLIMAFSMLTVGVAAAEFESYYEEPLFIYGDVNFDNRISVKDATAIQKYLAKIITLCEDSLYFGDVDGNGKNTISDATLIQKYVAKMIESFPVEAPENLYYVNADGNTLDIDMTKDDYITVIVNVENEGYYCMSATAGGETYLYLDICDGNYENMWTAQYDGEATYAVMKLVPGLYFATMYIEEGVDATASFKVEPTDYELPYNFDSATDLKIGDKIDIKAGSTPLIYKIDGSEIADDTLYIYTQGNDSRTSLECYDADFILTGYSDFYENTDSILEVYNYGTNNTCYVVINQEDGGTDFSVCCENTLGMLKSQSKEITVGTIDECEIVEYIEEDYVVYMSNETYRFTPENSGYYSLNLLSDTDFSVMGVISDPESEEEGYAFVEEGYADERTFDVFYLEEGKEYFVVLIVYLYGEGKLQFEVRESDEEEYKQLHTENSDDEIIPVEISVGDTITVSLDASSDEISPSEFILTATEDCEIVIYSSGSVDACVYFFSEDGECVFVGDDIFTAAVTNQSIDIFENFNFAVKGTLKKGETILFSIDIFESEENADSFELSVVNAKDYEPII